MLSTQRTWLGPSAKERLRILRKANSIAIVGFSTNPARASYFVGTYLVQSTDYRVHFVNPNAAGQTELGQTVYASLSDLPETPDIVVAFRRADDIPAVADEVAALRRADGTPPVLWVQLGIWNEDAAYRAEEIGLTVVMDRCIKIEHARFHGGLHLLGFDTGQITSRKTIR
ncbi:MAG: CoA-binding protein [Cryobacterium sp.]|nr:CoA-binding protein [Cryobacterium sp.]